MKTESTADIIKNQELDTALTLNNLPHGDETVHAKATDYWGQIISQCEHAFQPIVNIHSGVSFGFEALLRNTKISGFDTPSDLFDAAYHDGVLFRVEMALREKAITRFTSMEGSTTYRLFCNIDNRVIKMPDYHEGETLTILKRHGLTPGFLCFEISERHQFIFGDDDKEKLLHHYSGLFKVALDDFGTGYSGLQLLYHAEPDFIKIDRFFINGIHTDAKKKLFVSNIVGMAHVMGIRVIAEGVETEAEFYLCKEIGCDFVQGYLVQHPVTDLKMLCARYHSVEEINRKDKRSLSIDHDLLYDRIEYISPIVSGIDDISSVFEWFRKNETYEFVPVVNERYEPLGIICESQLKEWVYSPFGKDLLKNPLFGKPLSEFIMQCPSVSIRMHAEKILEVFTYSDQPNGVIVTDGSIYMGYLTSFSLLKVLNEKNVAAARDQNPLTKLPGNSRIHAYISESLGDASNGYAYIYFDFDNFKPFNDRYGFRRGDRALILFTEILKEQAIEHGWFIGHIGGDDFFAGCKCNGIFSRENIDVVIRRFSESMIALYDDEDRKRGFIMSTDREGRYREFPFMNTSCSVLVTPTGEKKLTAEDISYRIASLKKESKCAADHFACITLKMPE